MAKQTDPSEDDGGGEKQTSTRLFTADNLDLKQLAALLDISAADAYRRVCAPVVKDVLRRELKRKQAELDQGRK